MADHYDKIAAAERLRTARARANCATTAAAAERFGFKLATYYGHENGHRGLTPEAAARYARAYRVRAAWILYGDGASSPSTESPAEGEISERLGPRVVAQPGHLLADAMKAMADGDHAAAAQSARDFAARMDAMAAESAKGAGRQRAASDDDVGVR